MLHFYLSLQTSCCSVPCKQMLTVHHEHGIHTSLQRQKNVKAQKQHLKGMIYYSVVKICLWSGFLFSSQKVDVYSCVAAI